MIIHLVSSMRKFDEDLPFVQAIVDTIYSRGDSLALSWFDTAKSRREHSPATALKLNWKEQVEENMEAIRRSDAVIVEGSRYNFSQGYQTAIAIQYGKPVLNLYRTDQSEYQEWPDKNFVAGVPSSLFTSKAYIAANLQATIEQFLINVANATKELEIKIGLDMKTYSSLESLAQKTGRSKATIVKSILASAKALE